MASWSTQQLVEFLAGISACVDERSATRDAVERAAEALEAEVGAVWRAGKLVASVGFGVDPVAEQSVADVASGVASTLEVPGLGTCRALSAALGGADDGSLIVARAADEPFDQQDVSVFRGMARVLALTLRQLRLIESERALRERSESEASDRRAAQQELAHQALHDGLTGLPNRKMLLEHLRRLLAVADSDGTIVAALFVDLDNFKLINDTLGHHVGDELLRLVASRLRDSLRLTSRGDRPLADTVARFGGDEFVLVAMGLHSQSEALKIADRIASGFVQPFVIAGERLFVSASIGVATANERSTPDSLIRDADAAMYHAKAHGRARSALFDDEMRGRLLDRLSRESELRQALERHELTLYYQPMFSIQHGSIVGAESLVRWQHPDRGLLAADQFIPLAEETGLIAEIDHWVLREACRQLQEWRWLRTQPMEITLSVNLSARHVQDSGFPDRLAAVLRESGVDPRSISLEITESVLIESSDSPVAVLEGLRALGPRLILDDFGTGYSSLSYLRRFPLDAVKLDRSFVAGIGQPGRDRELVGALLHLAEVLGLEVVAEGVETEEQLASLAELGCPLAQGYHLGRPMPPAALRDAVLATRARSAVR